MFSKHEGEAVFSAPSAQRNWRGTAVGQLGIRHSRRCPLPSFPSQGVRLARQATGGPHVLAWGPEPSPHDLGPRAEFSVSAIKAAGGFRFDQGIGRWCHRACNNPPLWALNIPPLKGVHV